MPICKNCGEPIYQTRGGSWVQGDGRGSCSWAEPAPATDPDHHAERYSPDVLPESSR